MGPTWEHDAGPTHNVSMSSPAHSIAVKHELKYLECVLYMEKASVSQPLRTDVMDSTLAGDPSSLENAFFTYDQHALELEAQRQVLANSGMLSTGGVRQ